MERGVERALRDEDFIVVAPYNAHVRCLREKLPEAVRVGTVDKFQGQEATVVLLLDGELERGGRAARARLPLLAQPAQRGGLAGAVPRLRSREPAASGREPAHGRADAARECAVQIRGAGRGSGHLENLAGKLEERIGETDDLPAHGQVSEPFVRNPLLAVDRPCKLAIDRSARVRVVAEVDGSQRSGSEIVGCVKRPECCLERTDDIAASLNLTRSLRLNEPRAISSISGTSGPSCHTSSFNTESLSAPRTAVAIMSPRYRHASTAAVAPCVVRELSPDCLAAAARSDAYARGTGASRMIDPFPALRGCVKPACASPVFSNRSRASRVVIPMSKSAPVLELWPWRYQRTYRLS